MTKRGFLAYFEFVRTATRRLVTLVPDEHLDYRPRDNMFSMRELLNHFAWAESMTRNGILEDRWAADSEEQRNSRDEILAALDASFTRTQESIREFPEGKFLNKDVHPPGQPVIKAEVAFLGLILHEVHHRTQLFLYLKTLGLPVDSSTLFTP
jgi:uncharacterized damage-inducible protein DinB